MTDTLTPEARSALMARIVGRNTGPELAVRRLLHAMGYRFRADRRNLPGTPDIVLPGRRKIVFVHGCFWHGHAGCGPSPWSGNVRCGTPGGCPRGCAGSSETRLLGCQR